MSDARSRFSFMGAAGGPLSAVVTYDVGVGEVNAAAGGWFALGGSLTGPQPACGPDDWSRMLLFDDTGDVGRQDLVVEVSPPVTP